VAQGVVAAPQSPLSQRLLQGTAAIQRRCGLRGMRTYVRNRAGLAGYFCPGGGVPAFVNNKELPLRPICRRGQRGLRSIGFRSDRRFRLG